MRRSPAVRALSGVGAALLFACTESPTGPSDQPLIRASITADPAPSAPGIFLGTGVTAAGSLDIGSRGGHTAAQDCGRSTVFTASAAIECYWTVRAFGGWQGKSPKAGAYSSVLSVFGF